VDARGDTVRWNGARWSTPAGVDAAGFTAVSCYTGGCVAVDFAGNAVDMYRRH
jgi:hypothetical protein